jgi:hypothetical protein
LAIETAFANEEVAGGHCYSAHFVFGYHKKSMNELTTEFGYTNELIRNQKIPKRLEKSSV